MIKVLAQQKICQGEEITIQYVPFLYGHFKRKRNIRSGWYFDCNCKRCQDPTGKLKKEQKKSLHETSQQYDAKANYSFNV